MDHLKFTVLIVLALLGAACASVGERAPVMIVSLVHSAQGDQIVVDGQQVSLDAIDDVVLMEAMAANPRLSADEAHREARVVISAESAVRYALVLDVMARLREFEQIAVRERSH